MSEEWNDVDQSTLAKRAEELAQPFDLLSEQVETVPMLEILLLGGLRYGVELTRVEAVSRIGDIVSIPLTPKHISGMIRRHGVTFALVSLKHFFYPEIEGIADADFAVIVSAKNTKFALQVEEILGVSHLAKGEVKPVPENFDAAQAPYVNGVTTDGLAVLDLERLVDAQGFRAGSANK